MSLDIDSATAIVQFKGLGILCFNEALARAENLFIHKNDHTLLLEIFKPVSIEINDKRIADNKKEGEDEGFHIINNYWYEQYATYPPMLETDEATSLTIEVHGIGNPDVVGYAKYTPNDFHRDILADDENDLRWIVNPVSDGIFPGQDLLTIGDPEVEVSKLFISNATFYTATIPGFKRGSTNVARTAINFQKVALFDLTTAPENVVMEALQNAGPFGPVGEEIGAGIDADAVQLTITAGSEAHMHLFPRSHRPYIIRINNSAGTPESDIPIYRNFWGPSSEPTFNLLQEEVIRTTLDPDVDPVSGTEMCYGIITEDPPCIAALTGGSCPGNK